MSVYGTSSDPDVWKESFKSFIFKLAGEYPDTLRHIRAGCSDDSDWGRLIDEVSTESQDAKAATSLPESGSPGATAAAWTDIQARAYEEGANSWDHGDGAGSCPYREGTPEWNAWQKGFDEAIKDVFM